jgi:hypothetical protein
MVCKTAKEWTPSLLEYEQIRTSDLLHLLNVRHDGHESSVDRRLRSTRAKNQA